MDQTSYVHDGISNLIFLDEYVLAYNNLIKLSTEQYLKSANTITASAIILEVNKCLTKFYYRSFGLNDSLLIGVNFRNGIWKVNAYYENPSAAFLLSFFKKYLLRSNITMYRHSELAADFYGSEAVLQSEP
jgi:hypothetical protein